MLQGNKAQLRQEDYMGLEILKQKLQFLEKKTWNLFL